MYFDNISDSKLMEMSDGGTVKKQCTYSLTIIMITDNTILKNICKHPVDPFQKINRQVSGKVANEKLQINEFDKTIK